MVTLPPPSPSSLPFPTHLPPLHCFFFLPLGSRSPSPFYTFNSSHRSYSLISWVPSPSPLPMGAGASKPPIPATHPAGVAFRRKLEEIRRRRKVRAFRDSIVSTTELLKDRTDLESVGDVARLSAVGFETDSSERARDAAGAAKDDKLPGEKQDAAKEEAAVSTTAIASETTAIASGPAGNVVAAEVEADRKEAAEIDEKKEVMEVVVTKKVEITEAVTSLAAEVALMKIEEDGEEEEEEEKDGSELVAGDLPGSPSFRYFAMINNQAGDSDDSDENEEAAAEHGKDDDGEDGT